LLYLESLLVDLNNYKSTKISKKIKQINF